MVSNNLVKTVFIFLLLFSLGIAGKAQSLPEFNMADTTITECFGILYDSGGPGATYGPNENTTTTINTGGVLTLTFFGTFALENNLDSLYVYDGPNASSPLLGAYTGQTLPPVLTANSGIATFVLTSDGNVSGAGFAMEWASTQPQPIPPAISVNSIPSCNASQFNINFSTPVQCAWLNTAVFTVSANGQNVPVSSFQQNCAGGQTSLVTLVMAQPFTYNCNFLVNMVLEIPDNCGVIYSFNLGTSFLFENCGVNATVTSDSPNVCPGGCTNIQAEVSGCFTYTYAWSNGLPPTAGPHQVCLSSPTTYSVTITELETSNSVVKTITIGIEDVTIVTPAQTVCQSAPAISMQAGAVGVWSGDGITAGTNQFVPDNAGGGVHTIYFNTPNCADSVDITVTAIQTQNVTAACPGSAAFQLQATPTGGTWNGPNTTVTGMFDPVNSGVFTIDYLVNGCTDQLTVNVDNIQGPFTLDPICQSIWFDTLSFSPYGGTWSGQGIVDASQGIFSPSLALPGNDQLTYTINGCDALFDIFVKEINIDYFQEVCPDENPMILDNTPVPVGGIWSSPDGAITNTSTGLFDPGTISNNTFTYINYQAPNGCIDTLFVFVIKTDVVNEELSFCINDPVTPLDSALTGGMFPDAGIWTGPGVTGNAANGFNFNPQVVALGPHELYYTANNCIDTVVVTVFPPGIANAPQTFCSNELPVLLAPGIVDGGTWEGSGIVDPVTGLFDPAVADIGTYYVHWTNPAGCNDSISVTVEEFATPSITGLDTEYCMQDITVNFSASPDGGILVGDLSGFSFNPNTLGQGNYQVIYKITPLICPALSDTVDFEIFPAITLGALSASSNPICPDEAVTVTASPQGGNPNNPMTYTWSTGGASSPTNTSVPGQSTTITVTVADGCSQPVNASIDIAVFSEFLMTPITSDTLCIGELGFASMDLFPPGAYTTTWNGAADPDNFVEANAGTTYNVVVTDQNGCNQDTTVTIPAFPPVIAGFSITPNVGCVQFEDMGNIIFTDNSANGSSGSWDFGNGTTLSYVAGQSLIQAYPGPGNYTITLQIQNAGGCTNSITQDLCIQPADPIFIPDIFSPNSDKRNDTLFVRGLFITKMEFKVYDRWGEAVFVSEDPTKGWDGQHRGQPAPSGSYFFTLKATVGGNEKIDKSGEIVLIR